MKEFSIILFFVTSLFTGLTSIGHAGGHLPDLVETAVKGGKFKTLVTAVEAASLVETLKGKGPFTVFAPTDEAFAKIDSATLAYLLKLENKDKLAAILTYHVVAGQSTKVQIHFFKGSIISVAKLNFSNSSVFKTYISFGGVDKMCSIISVFIPIFLRCLKVLACPS